MKVAHGKLYVAGGFSGAVWVYDIATKQLVASFQTGGGGMLNDLVVTKTGTYSSPTRSVPRCGVSQRRKSRRAAARLKAFRSGPRSVCFQP